MCILNIHPKVIQVINIVGTRLNDIPAKVDIVVPNGVGNRTVYTVPLNRDAFNIDLEIRKENI